LKGTQLVIVNSYQRYLRPSQQVEVKEALQNQVEDRDTAYALNGCYVALDQDRSMKGLKLRPILWIGQCGWKESKSRERDHMPWSSSMETRSKINAYTRLEAPRSYFGHFYRSELYGQRPMRV
jgi:hypothetical protein